MRCGKHNHAHSAPVELSMRKPRKRRVLTIFWQIGRSAAPALTALQPLFFYRLQLAVRVGWGGGAYLES